MNFKEYSKHDSVPKKYTWNLDDLLEGKKLEELIKNYFNIFRQRIKTKDTKFNSKISFLSDLKITEKQEIVGNKIMNYISNSLSLNINDVKIRGIQEELSFRVHQFSEEFGSETNRIFKNVKKIREWIKDKEFDNWRHNFNALLESKKYKLPDKISEFRIKASRGYMSTHEVFNILTNTEIDYGFAITSNGKKIKITPSNRSKLAKHKDKNVRKTSIINWRKGFLQHKQSLSNMLFQHMKSEVVESKLHNFKSTLDGHLFPDRINEDLIVTLFEEVQANKDIFRKYKLWHKKFYKIKFKENMTKYDWAVELTNVKSSFTIEESQKMIFNSLKPLGKEYTDKIKEAFNNNWIDYMPVKTKTSGAYSIGSTYGINKKLILMNFDGELRSVETLAHELGHSMHSYYSDKVQPYQKSAYPIFLAEIASIFNELMLFDYLLENSDNDKLKFNILTNIIDGFMGTVNRQVEWANFEYDMYKSIEAGIPVNTYEAISKLYFENSKKYSLKKNPKYKKDECYMSIVVPHFYYGFYVYKYAIGQLTANIFFSKYKKDGKNVLKNYIDKFLSAGAKDWPINILRESGIDLNNPEIYKLGFKNVEKYINEWIRLGKKIF